VRPGEHLVQRKSDREHVDRGRELAPARLLGAMYSAVPTAVPVRVTPARSVWRAMPRSASTARPSFVSSTFAGLMSRLHDAAVVQHREPSEQIEEQRTA
jgi:hypothetical protein